MSANDALTYVNRDRDYEIRYCRPTAKTKSFAVVQPDGNSLRLDPVGNEKAAELVRQRGKKSRTTVRVTGEVRGGKVKVDSLSTAK